jgi:protein-S-isoprenylcysteine O-methyltransferase Ste14
MDLLRTVYHARGWLVSPPLVLAAVCFEWETETPLLIWPLGLALVLAGVALRVWAQEHICFRLKMHRHLATTGPYAFMRNPLYVANTLICVGATVLSELLWLVPITLLWCAGVYTLVVLQEERRLLAKYGEDYAGYIARVPRWVPHAIRPGRLGFVTEHFGKALLIEASCLLVVAPCVAKELVSPWFEH